MTSSVAELYIAFQEEGKFLKDIFPKVTLAFLKNIVTMGGTEMVAWS